MRYKSNITKPGLNPLVKEFVLLLTIGIVLLNPGLRGSIEAYLIWFGILWVLWFIAGLNIQRAKLSVLVGTFLSVILVITQGFLYRNGETYTPLFTLFNFEISGRSLGVFTLEGLFAGLIGSLKIYCVLISAQMFISTTSIEDFTWSLIKLRVPYSIAFIMVTAMRFVPLVENTWRDILDAKRLRGLNVDKLNFLRKITSLYPQSIVPLVLSLFKVGLNLNIAIITRGFHVQGKKTLYYTVRMRTSDYIVSVALALIFTIDIILLFGLW